MQGKGLEYINSSGSTSFIHVEQILEGLYQKLSICELQPPIKEVTDIADMGTYFKIFSTEKKALDS